MQVPHIQRHEGAGTCTTALRRCCALLTVGHRGWCSQVCTAVCCCGIACCGRVSGHCANQGFLLCHSPQRAAPAAGGRGTCRSCCQLLLGPGCRRRPAQVWVASGARAAAGLLPKVSGTGIAAWGGCRTQQVWQRCRQNRVTAASLCDVRRASAAEGAQAQPLAASKRVPPFSPGLGATRTHLPWMPVAASSHPSPCPSQRTRRPCPACQRGSPGLAAC